MALSSLTTAVTASQSEYRNNQKWRPPWSRSCLCPRRQIDLGELYLSCLCSPLEGMSVCLSSCNHSTFCPARVVLCLAATQICSECLMYIPKTECLSHLDTWPDPSLRARLDPKGTFTLRNQLTCTIMTHRPQTRCILSFSHPPTCSFTCLLSSYIPSLSLLFHPCWLCPWGVSLTFYMPRQLHSSPLHARVFGHSLDGGVCWAWVAI